MATRTHRLPYRETAALLGASLVVTHCARRVAPQAAAPPAEQRPTAAREAPEARDASVPLSGAAAEQAVRARLAGLALPRSDTPGLAPVEPRVRLVISAESVSVDDAAVRARAPSGEGAVVATVQPDVVALRRGLVPPELKRDGVQGFYVIPVADALASIARADGAAPRWINVYADGATPARTLYEELYTAAASGFDSFALVTRARAGGDAAFELVPSPAVPPAGSGPGELLTIRGSDARGFVLAVREGHLQPGCLRTGPAVAAVPLADGRLDVAGLHRCVAAARGAPLWGTRLARQRMVQLTLTSGVHYEDIIAALAAVRESRPGARDWFTQPILGVVSE